MISRINRTVRGPGRVACQSRSGTAAASATTGIHCAAESTCPSRISSAASAHNPPASEASRSLRMNVSVEDSEVFVTSARKHTIANG